MKIVLVAFILISNFGLFAQEARNSKLPDVAAEFPGGAESMKKFIQDNVVYPEFSRQMGDEGRVYVQFIVEPDGSISSITVLRKLTDELDAEAKRVVSIMPNWKPGLVMGKPIRSRCTLPITFTFTDPIENEDDNK